MGEQAKTAPEEPRRVATGQAKRSPWFEGCHKNVPPRQGRRMHRMPNTYSKLLYHLVFSTKGRANLISQQLQPRLFDYMGGIVRDERGTLLEIGGLSDHVHLLIRWRTDESLATLMRNLKSNSTRWVHETFPTMEGFAWQQGYAAFTVSASQADDVARYIRNQEEHHRGRSFEDELIRLLDAHGVDYERRYLSD